MEKNKIKGIVLFAILGLSIFSLIPFQFAYAQTLADVNIVEINAPGSRSCSGITQTSNGMVWQLCTSATNFNVSTITLYLISGNTILNQTNISTAANAGINMRIWSVASNQVLVTGGSSSSPQARLYEVTSTSNLDLVSQTSLSACTPIGSQYTSRVGTTLVVGCTNGEVRLLSQGSNIQIGSFSGMTTGSPTCTTFQSVMLYSSNAGVAICDNTTLIAFTISGSTVTKGDSVTVSTSVTNQRMIFANGFIYFTGGANAIAFNESTRTFSGDIIAIPTASSGTDMAIAQGGYWVTIGGGNVFLLNASIAPPNNIEFNSNSGVGTGAAQRVGTFNSQTFVMSKGASSENNYNYVIINNIILDGQPDVTGGIDCTIPANINILICRIASQTGGNLGGVGGILDTGIFNVLVNSGLISGADTDPKTNGIGYFITILGFGIMAGMFFVATKGEINKIPTFVWMLSAIALLGGITAIGWIDPTFLIIGIVAIIGLAAMQIRNTIGSGIDFGGGGRF